jgi:Na+-transporting NADH:ubiquinone oxidoreductase subunit NqrD
MSSPNINNPYLPGVVCIPSTLEITAITNAFPMAITTTMNSDQANTYIPGMAVRLFVPISFRMWQANNLIGTIVSVVSNVISVNIDSRNFDLFIVPSGGTQPASLSPNGSRNYQYSNSSNIVPFQNLNNIGN